MRNDQPLVSVIMSVYNCKSSLSDALRSIKEQTYTNWEIIICDDASTDGTLELIKEEMKGFDGERFKLITNESNRKLAFSLNRCLEIARGEYVARMDGDDISEVHRFEEQIKFLESNPEIDLVGSSMQRFNDRGFGDIVYPPTNEPDKWSLGKTSSVPFNHATILARRTVFEKVGNYTVSWRTERGQDLDLWFKFFGTGLVGRNISEPLYRVREDEAAIRRRTPKARLGAVITRIKGSRNLHYPIFYYRVPLLEFMKIFVPYSLYDFYRRRTGQSQKATASYATEKNLEK